MNLQGILVFKKPLLFIIIFWRLIFYFSLYCCFSFYAGLFLDRIIPGGFQLVPYIASAAAAVHLYCSQEHRVRIEWPSKVNRLFNHTISSCCNDKFVQISLL